jgi:hypothetical protein
MSSTTLTVYGIGCCSLQCCDSLRLSLRMFVIIVDSLDRVIGVMMAHLIRRYMYERRMERRQLFKRLCGLLETHCTSPHLAEELR